MTAWRYPTLAGMEPAACLRLLRCPQVGPVTFFQLLLRFGSPEAALDALPELARRGGRTERFAPPSENTIAREMEATAEAGAEYIPYGHAYYPPALGTLYDPPPVLIVKGRKELLRRVQAVGIVGARNASAAGRQCARQLARGLAEAEATVISGLARGIDAEAHQGALAAGEDKGGTVGVIATGIDGVYPPQHEKLQARMGEEGAVVTEYPIGTEPLARQFPARNRIIAGISRGVAVVEASLQSGSLITARLAGEYGREVFAVPGSPLDSRCRGSNALLKEGAGLVEEAEDILTALPPAERESLFQAEPLTPPKRKSEAKDRGGGSKPADNENSSVAESYPSGEAPQEARGKLLAMLGPSPVAVDELCEACQIAPNQLLILLLELEMAGRLERLPGQRVARVA